MTADTLLILIVVLAICLVLVRIRILRMEDRAFDLERRVVALENRPPSYLPAPGPTKTIRKIGGNVWVDRL